ncbi:MAG: extracellular solute-binding protein, partial [Eubacteriales bacterium]
MSLSNVYEKIAVNGCDTVSYYRTYVRDKKIYAVDTVSIEESHRVPGYRIVSLGIDGTDKQTYVDIPYPKNKDGSDIIFYNFAFAIYSDGSTAVYTQNGSLYRFDSSGEIMYEAEIDYTWGDSIYISPDDTLYRLTERTLFIYAPDLSLIAEVDARSSGSRINLTGLCFDKEGKIIVSTTNSTYYVLADDNSGFLTYTDIKKPDNIAANAQLFFGEGYDAYFKDQNGIWGVNSGSDKGELLMSFQNSYILFDNLDLRAVIDADNFVAVVVGALTGCGELVQLRRVPDGFVKPKVLVTLAKTTHTDSYLLDKAAAQFNAENDVYSVIIKDYTPYISITDKNGAQTQIGRELIDGTAPDILMLDRDMMNGVRDYVSKDAFADMSGELSRNGIRLLGCVKNMYGGSGIYYVPLSLYIDTLVGAKAIVGGERLTPDSAAQMADGLAAGVTMLSLTDRDTAVRAALGDYIDYENKTCSFDSKQFTNFIEFANRIGTLGNISKGFITGTGATGGGRAYSISGQSLKTNLSDGKLLLLNTTVTSMDSFAVLKSLCGGELALKGFPCVNSVGAVVSSLWALSVNEASKHQRGAAEFINYLLSDAVQTCSALAYNGVPVTKSAADALLMTHNYIYYAASDDAKSSGDITVSCLFSTNELPRDDHPYVEMAQEHIVLSDAERSEILAFLDTAGSRVDDHIGDIVNDELSAFYAGDITASAAAKHIQNR